jgi:hypothetical protein
MPAKAMAKGSSIAFRKRATPRSADRYLQLEMGY